MGVGVTAPIQAFQRGFQTVLCAPLEMPRTRQTTVSPLFFGVLVATKVLFQSKTQENRFEANRYRRAGLFS